MAHKSEAEERVRREKHDATDYVDWSTAKKASMPNLKPTTATISRRLPDGVLDHIKVEANKRDMPYQFLVKAWLAWDIDEHRGA